MDDCFEKSDKIAQWQLSGEQGSLAETRQDCSTGEIPMQGGTLFAQAPPN
jgi:hypothetical protein